MLPWDEAATEHYGDLRAGLERRGKPLSAMDLLIAAHARSCSATLVGNDVRHFERVEGLLVAVTGCRAGRCARAHSARLHSPAPSGSVNPRGVLML